MSELLTGNGYMAIVLTLSTYAAGRALQSRFRLPVLNPLLISSILVAVFLTVFRIPVESYQSGCAPLQYLLTPATVCYAVSMYEQIGAMKKHLAAILAGVLSGTVVSLLSIRAMAAMFGLDHILTVSLLPKSITTAIGMVLAQEAGGIAAIATFTIVLTGILGNILGPWLCKVLRLRDPVSQGVAFGTASHAIGTSKAVELGQLTGAVSSMSLTFAGLITVVLFSFLV